MKTFFCILIPIVLMSSCTSSPKKSYRSHKFHPDKKHYTKVDDVITDKTLKGAGKQKKKDEAGASKYRKKQVAHLKQLNSGNGYKNSKKNDAVFHLY